MKMEHNKEPLSFESTDGNAVLLRILIGFLFCVYAISTFYPLLERIIAENFYFTGLPINGAFQMLNPLKRMDLGQIPGKDFYFFHGIGTLLLHRPFYLLLGKGLWASNTSIYIVGFLTFVISLYVFLRGLGLRKYYSFLLIPVFSGFLFNISPELIFFKLNTPGARSFFPIFSIGFLLLSGRYLLKKETELYQLLFCGLAGILAATSFFISIEHGLSFSMAIMGGMLIFSPFRFSFTEKILNLCLFISTLAFFIFLFFFLVSGGDWYKSLHMSLVTIPKQQFWYFGAPPHTIIKNFWTFLFFPPTLYVYFIYIGVGLLGIYGVLFWLHRSDKLERLYLSLLIVFLLYGLLTTASILGYFSKIYFLPLVRVLLLAIFALLYWLGRKTRLEDKLIPHTVTKRTWEIAGVFFLTGVAALLLHTQVISPLSKQVPVEHFIRKSWNSGWQLLFLVLIPFVGEATKKRGRLDGASWANYKYFHSIPVVVTLAMATVLAQFADARLYSGFTSERFDSYRSDVITLSNRWYQNFSAIELLLGPYPHLQYRSDTKEWAYFTKYREKRAHLPPKEPPEFLFPNEKARDLSTNIHFFFKNKEVPDELSAFSWLRINGQTYGWVKSTRKIGDYTKIELDFLRTQAPSPAMPINSISIPHTEIEQGDLWFTYANVMQYGYGVINPATDYIIHLLDQDLKDEYLMTFRQTKPRWVGTIRGHEWAPWLQYTHFDFYQLLYRFYTPRLLTRDYVIWEKQSSDWDEAEDVSHWRTLFLDNHQTYRLPVGEFHTQKLIVLRIDYQTKNDFAALPIAGRTPRFWIKMRRESPPDPQLIPAKREEDVFELTPISLPPKPSGGQVDIPVLLPADSSLILSAETVSPFGLPVELDIKRMKYREMSIDPEVNYVLNEFPVFYTPLF